ncbi:hypothetical protein [Frankia sp. AgKG'84/4]|uniref:hypothetical protein n=1 Tax=Frankia sp. AgKG'84/4 TaxID=573490 RepID=UPI00200EB0DC|nr:hypothetical protein [Frankia sp. AgKG'84/4]MCL9792735.1 hypothetical protein [Frankia sp. AgKG'84/4]
MRERAYALNEALVSGPPPLGPGAAAAERPHAFLDAVVDLVGRNKGLVAALGAALPSVERSDADTHRMGETGPAASPGRADPDEGRPVHDVWHAHISMLIDEERTDLDADLVAHVLLSSLHSDPILRLLEAGEGPRLAATLRALAGALIAAPAR